MTAGHMNDLPFLGAISRQMIPRESLFTLIMGSGIVSFT